MTASTENSGELDRQLRAAADQAVMGIPGAVPLGEGDFARIRSRVSGQSMSLTDRVLLAASYAREIAIANRDEPRNRFDGRGPQIAELGAGPHGLHGFGARTNPLWRGRDADGEKGEPPASSAAYARGGLNGAGDPAFLKSVGITSATAAALGEMGFKTQAQVKELTRDAGLLGVDKNRGSVALGMMKSGDPSTYASNVHFFQHVYRTGLNDIAKIDAAIAGTTDPAKRAELERQRAKMAAELEAKRQRQRDKMKGKPKAQQGFDAMGQLIQNNVNQMHRLKPAASREQSSTETISTLPKDQVDRSTKAAGAKKAEFEQTAALDDDMWGGASTEKKPEPAATPKPPATKAAQKAGKIPGPDKPKPAVRTAGSGASPSVG